MDVKELLSADRPGEQGYTVNEFLVLSTVILTIVGLAVPGFVRMHRQAKNEASAIDQLRTIAASQLAYATSCGAGGYAVDFGVLGKPPVDSNTGFLPAEFSQTETPQQSGYHFGLDASAVATAGPLDCHGIPTQSAYIATAQPVEFGIAGTGRRSFAITSNNTIWQVRSGSPPDEPFANPEIPLR
jgi:hypothetical protein